MLLHELFNRADDWRRRLPIWNGPIYALDFSGHGQSESVAGGAYFAELLAGDADCALDQTAAVALAGAGIGAYVALLLAGGRPERVHGALLLPGRGLSGGAAFPYVDPPPPLVEEADARSEGGPDPLLYILERDVRPIDYAASFGAQARKLILAEDGTERPPWWEAVRAAPGSIVLRGGVEDGFRELARIVAR